MGRPPKKQQMPSEEDPFEVLDETPSQWIKADAGDGEESAIETVAVDEIEALFDRSLPAEWIGSQLRGIWRLVYEAGGPRCRATGSGPMSLSPDVRTSLSTFKDELQPVRRQMDQVQTAQNQIRSDLSAFQDELKHSLRRQATSIDKVEKIAVVALVLVVLLGTVLPNSADD